MSVFSVSILEHYWHVRAPIVWTLSGAPLQAAGPCHLCSTAEVSTPATAAAAGWSDQLAAAVRHCSTAVDSWPLRCCLVNTAGRLDGTASLLNMTHMFHSFSLLRLNTAACYLLCQYWFCDLTGFIDNVSAKSLKFSLFYIPCNRIMIVLILSSVKLKRQISRSYLKNWTIITHTCRVKYCWNNNPL